uniref:Uncharacterized protein 103E1.025 n=1 Tax=Neurospora crassa TaxID=5141 RepID=Q870Z7_NEUCS|nr:hypothetical protein [Neurospora crassa]
MPLQQHVVERVQPMFDYAYKRMEEAYDVCRENVLSEFVSTFAFDKVKQHFYLLSANLNETKKSTGIDSPRCKEEGDDSIALKQNVSHGLEDTDCRIKPDPENTRGIKPELMDPTLLLVASKLCRLEDGKVEIDLTDD